MKLDTHIRKLNELINSAYTSAADADPWYTFVVLFKELLDAKDVAINLRRKPRPEEFDDESRYYLVTSNKSFRLAPEHVDEVTRVSNRMLDLEHPRPALLRESDLENVFSSSPSFKQILEPLNVEYVLVMDVHRTDTVCMKLTAERSSDQASFSTSDKELMEIAGSHLQRAMLYQSEKRGGLKLLTFYAHILDKLALGGILLDENGSVVSTNATADKAIESGIGIRIQAGQLIAADNVVEQQELRNAIALAANAARNNLTAQPGKVIGMHNNAGELVMEVVVKPYIVDVLSSAGVIPSVSVIISQNFLDDSPLDFQLLSSMYGFTPQEAKVAARIGTGRNVTEIATEMKVSINTTKTHLRGIYSKTGYNRQSQIVALMSRSLARLI